MLAPRLQSQRDNVFATMLGLVNNALKGPDGAHVFVGT